MDRNAHTGATTTLSRRRRWFLFSVAFASLLLCGLSGAVGAVAAYEYAAGGAPRVGSFFSGQLQQERLQKGDSRFPEGFVMGLGFTAGGILGLFLWKWGARRFMGLTKGQTDDVMG